jgi:membrane fusion protein, macrolide-specific efflux system
MKKASGSKKKWIKGVAALGLVIAAGIAIKFGTSRQRGIKYQIAEVTRGDIKSTILSTGTVAPYNRLDLKPPVAGRIEKVLVQEGQWVKAGQILAWMSSTERATLIDTARAKGPEELAYWEASYKMTPILAPGRGLIILKNSDSGTTVAQTDIVLSMSDRLIVKANVDETDLAQVKNGLSATIILDAFPTNPVDSSVVHVGYDAKTVNNVTTYEVDVAPKQIPPFMKSGMTANVTFLIEERENVLVVPASSIHRERHHIFVLVPGQDPQSEPEKKEVKLGISDGKKIEVLSGIEEGQKVLQATIGSLARKEGQLNSPFGGPGGGGGGRPPH